MDNDTKIEAFERNEQMVQADRTSVEIKNLIVGSTQPRNLVVGDASSLANIAHNEEVKSVFWNEDAMCLVLADRSQMVVFEPELNPVVETFFQRAEKTNRRNAESNHVLAWEGDYSPLQFTKRDFLKWVALHADQIPKDVVANIKSLKIKSSMNISEDIIDDDTERTFGDVTETTNVPKKFTLNLPVMEGVRADMSFEAEIVQLKDAYDRPSNKRGIQLRCINARDVKRDLMRGILEQLPTELPQYYGRVQLVAKK